MFLKRIRGIAKMFLPCAVQWEFMRRRYGMSLEFREPVNPNLAGRIVRFFMKWMPYGLVKRYEVSMPCAKKKNARHAKKAQFPAK